MPVCKRGLKVLIRSIQNLRMQRIRARSSLQTKHDNCAFYRICILFGQVCGFPAAHQSFLHRRCNQAALPVVDRRPGIGRAPRTRWGCPGYREATRRHGTAGGTTWRGPGSRAGCPCRTAACRGRRARYPEGEVGCVGQNGLVDVRIVVQRAVRFEPDRLLGRPGIAAHVAGGIDHADVDRPLLRQ